MTALHYRIRIAPTTAPTQEAVVPSWRRKLERVEWFKGGNSIIKRGGYASLYEIDTSLTLRIKRKGGTNHMDVEPVTKADTATLKRSLAERLAGKATPLC